MSEPSVRRAGVIVLVFVIGGKLIGFLREVVIAGTYGTSQTVDIYLAAVTIPALINGILYQALPNAFIPLFARSGGNQDRTRRVAWIVLAAMACVSGCFWFFAVPIASLTNAGFASPLKAETVGLVRIIGGSVFLGTIEALARSRLLAQKRFIQTGISSLWLSLALIVAVLMFPQGGAHTLAWGFLAGAACVALWNLIPFGQRLAGQSDLAGDQVEGSIASLQYATVVASQPLAICATALGTAIFPYLSDRMTAHDHAGAATLFDRAVRWALFGAIPSAIAVSLLGDAMITVLFERGEFDASARIVTGTLLSVYGIWIIPAVIGTVMGKVFYAGLRWRPIMLAIGVALLLKTGLSFWWVRSYDVVGLVGATTVATAVSAALIVALLPAWSTRGLWTGWLRLAAVTALIFAIPCFLARMLPGILPMFSWKASAFISLLTGIGGGSGLLLVFGPRFGVMETVKIRIAIEAILLHRR
jgi:putative peptidoglycan lipid II flippase